MNFMMLPKFRPIVCLFPTKIPSKLNFYIDKKNNDAVKIIHNDKFGWQIIMTLNRSKTLLSRLKNLSNPLLSFSNNENNALNTYYSTTDE